MLLTVLAAFAAATVAPAVHRAAGRYGSAILAMVPAALVLYFISHPVADYPLVERYAWAPALGIELSFMLDGLSRLFALLITGIGTLILVYTGPYMADHRFTGRLLALLLLFLGSMLGLVLAENVLTLYVFWELTSISSYLLIGFDHHRLAARSAALQALLVTTLGGLAMLAGLILLGQAAGGYDLTTILSSAAVVQADPSYAAASALILLGAFTKSAQFPFHFWLPNAMEAPTPVSAYLHSSTMVKAGLYLLARLSPALGGTDLWFWSVTTVGAITMIVGAAFALSQTEFKRILAYSTVSALGLIVLFIGLGSEDAATAAMAFLLAHAFYKGTLFLVAGSVLHATDEQRVDKVAGLARSMPITAAAALVAALSMAGLPPFMGFIGKELAIESALHADTAGWVFAGLTVLAGALLFAVAGAVGFAPFFASTPRATRAHEASVGLWIGPVLLATLGALTGLLPDATATPLVQSAAAAILGVPTAAHEVSLSLWHGVTPTLVLGLSSMALGAVLYAGRARYRTMLGAWPERISGSAAYQWTFDGLQALAQWQTRVVQDGYLRHYLLITLATTVLLVGGTLVANGLPGAQGWGDLRPHEALLVAVIVLGAVVTILSHSRLGAVAALGVVGFGVALIFAQFGAPDLAMTQFAIETLSVILLVFALYHMPARLVSLRRSVRWRDAAVALAGGATITLLVLLALEVQIAPSIGDYYMTNSAPAAHGHNVVNVILVDFRGVDTMGEITVLGIAATGVYALLRLRSRDDREAR